MKMRPYAAEQFSRCFQMRLAECAREVVRPGEPHAKARLRVEAFFATVVRAWERRDKERIGAR